MSARAGFGFEQTNEKPKFQSRFNAKPNGTTGNRRPLIDITNTNNFGFEEEEFQPRGQQQQQTRQLQPPPDFGYDPVEYMHLPGPDPKYHGFEFKPSKEIWFETEIELEPLPILDPVHW